ncbi:MAG: heavy-metal-associated domain-containing protein [Planctomycetes bacterium]|nr:heavy-metal-associated domain-containing protein [Planctomycetota bacterium]
MNGGLPEFFFVTIEYDFVEEPAGTFTAFAAIFGPNSDIWPAPGCLNPYPYSLAFFPNYVGLIFPSQNVLESESITSAQRLVTLRIEKMTCEGCAAVVQSALAKVPGVNQCSVSYEAGEAVCVVNSNESPSLDELAQAVAAAGYRALLGTEIP